MAHGIQDKPMALWKQELNIATFGCSIRFSFQTTKWNMLSLFFIFKIVTIIIISNLFKSRYQHIVI